MKLLDHFERAGNAFFRLRSYLPLLLLPPFLLAVRAGAATGDPWRPLCEWGGFLVSLAGFGVRVFTIGSAPPGTSGRGTRDPYAAVLNTTGAYSVVRHPLYLGNTLVALGLGIFTTTWFMPLVIVLASLLYHERICVREEVFLESQFGDSFRAWARKVPALVPAFGRYRPPEGRFRWKKVLSREFHALLVIGAGFLFLDVLRHVFRSGDLGASPLWMAVCAGTALVFVVLAILKKWTSVLSVQETTGPSPTGA